MNYRIYLLILKKERATGRDAIVESIMSVQGLAWDIFQKILGPKYLYLVAQ